MGIVLCKCCCRAKHTNSVGILPEKQFKVVLLGLLGSGKTEIGYRLNEKQRTDYESTNGVQCYRMKLEIGQLSITEIGGNEEMQKIWHHYFVTAMGLIYCVDFSVKYDELKKSFDVLCKTLAHPHMRGKPILLVATKTDLMHESVQLYDIENTFQLEALARYYLSSLHLCYYEHRREVTSQCDNSLFDGIKWLTSYLRENYDILNLRIKCDTNMKNWQNQTNKLIAEGVFKPKRYQRFPIKVQKGSKAKFWRLSYKRRRHSGRIRPHTAPSVFHTFASQTVERHTITSTETITIPNSVPELANETVITQGETVTDV